MSDSTSPKPFVFVLMPFAKEYNDIYQLGIKAACEEAGTYCERVDEQIFTERILDRIYNQIAKADIIVSDMSNRNPNVFYETGYAHALDKQVVHLTQKVEDIPFDLTHFPHIIYDTTSISVLKEEIKKRVTWLLQNPRNSINKLDFNLNLSINNIPLIDNPIIPIDINDCLLTVKIHNQVNQAIQLSQWRFGLFTPSSITSVFNSNSVRTLKRIELEEANIHSLDQIEGQLLPDEWCQHKIIIRSEGNLSEDFYDLAIKIYGEVSPKEFPFRIQVIRQEK